MWPFGQGRERRLPETDPEARRAHEALQQVRSERRGRPAAPEWRQLQSARRKRRAVRAAARIAAVIALVLAGAGLSRLGVMGFAWLRAETDLFRVKSILISGTDRLAEADICSAAGLRVGDDILSLDMEALARRIEELPRVKDAVARRTLKREVFITIRERRPLALVFLDSMHEVDEDGVVLPPDSQGGVADLMLILGLKAGAVTCGRRLEAPGLMPALHLIRILSSPEVGLDAAVSEIRAAEPDSLVMVLLAQGVPVRVGNGDIPPRRLTAFRAVIEDLARRKVDPEYLDLRFAGQIVVKPRPEPPEDSSEKSSEVGAAGTGKPGTEKRGRRSQHGLNT